jgi:hypothetical protein
MMFTTDSRAAASNQDSARVYDIGDPGAYGTVLTEGEQVSEVRFDDGRQRFISNENLRVVSSAGGGLCQHNPPSHPSEIVRLGQEAMARKRRAWDDWLLIAEALQVGRAEVMRELHTNEPKGRRFEKAMNEWLIAHSFKEIDKGARCRLLACLKHRVDIEAWRSRLTDAERVRFNHPDVVLRRWKAATAAPKADAEPKPSPMQELKDKLVTAIEERDCYRREIERGGGDLWTPRDTAKDIATVIFARVSASKAQAISRELARMLKSANSHRDKEATS